MIYTYKNFSEAKLASQLNSGDSQMTVTVASTLPTTGTFIAVIWNAQLYADAGKDPDVEIVLAVHSSGYVYNLTRAQESTTAKTHVAGATVGLYLTSAAFSDLVGATGPQGPQGEAGFPGGYTGMQVFTSSGTWTKPTGITKVLVKVIGGGGESGTNSASPGNTGGTSSFAGTTTIQATGGIGGVNTGGGGGGTGSGGSFNLSGVTGTTLALNYYGARATGLYSDYGLGGLPALTYYGGGGGGYAEGVIAVTTDVTVTVGAGGAGTSGADGKAGLVIVYW
jgi:hypothetical protein